MSISAYPVIWAMKHAPVADREERLILWELADSGDPDGCDCYRSVGSMADTAMCSPATVKRRLRELERRGVIRRQAEPPNKPSWTRQPANRKTVAWELMIPTSWWSDQQRAEVNKLRADRGTNAAPITPELRPDLPPTKASRATRADRGMPNPNRRGVSQTPQETDSGGSHRPAQGGLTDTSRGVSQTPNPPVETLPYNPPPLPPYDDASASGTGTPSVREEENQESKDIFDRVSLVADKEDRDGHQRAARELLTCIPRTPWRLSRRQINQLVPLVAAALADPVEPWDPDDLYAELTQRPDGIRNPFRVLRSRLAHLSAPPAKAIQPTAAEWCGQCESPDYRWVARDDGSYARCRTCNPYASTRTEPADAA